MHAGAWLSLSQPLALLVLAAAAPAQQVADTAYRFKNPNPAYPLEAGPQVCIDAGHRNFHTMDGRYRPFATLLQQDGYQVRSIVAFGQETLEQCDIIVTANPSAAANEDDWSYPHPSAFSKEEIGALVTWVGAGGSLLLIVDHSPIPGAAADLAVVLGFHLFDGYAVSNAEFGGIAVFGSASEETYRQIAEWYDIPYDRFRRIFGEPGALNSHATLEGRAPTEKVSSVVTFTGTAILPSRDVEGVLVFGQQALGIVVLTPNVPDEELEEPVFSLSGWLQAGVRRIGKGRVAVLGEAAMCTAQLVGEQRAPMGMSAPFAAQNPQFCLNMVRWLSGLLD